MKCLNCGSELKDTAKFCAFCGTKVEAKPAMEEAPAEEIKTAAQETSAEEHKAVIQPAENVSTETDTVEPEIKEAIYEPAAEEVKPVDKEPVKEEKAQPAAEKDTYIEKPKPVKTEKPQPIEEIKPVKAKKKSGKGVIIAVIAVVLIAGGAASYPILIQPTMAYNSAAAAMDEGRYADAYSEFAALGDFKDSSSKASAAIYLDGKQKLDSGDYAGAIAAFSTYNYPNFKEMITKCNLAMAESKLASGDYEGAAADFLALGDKDKYTEVIFAYAEKLASDGDFAAAKAALEPVAEESFNDVSAQDKIKEYGYLELCAEIDSGVLDEEYARTLKAMDGYMDSAERYIQLCKTLGDSYYTDLDYISAAAMYKNVGTEEANAKISECLYNEAVKLSGQGDKDSARNLFAVLGNFRDSAMKKAEAARAVTSSHNTWNVDCTAYLGDFATTNFKAGETITVSGKAGNEMSPAAAAVYAVQIVLPGEAPKTETVSGMRMGAEFSMDFETSAETKGTAEIRIMLPETATILYKFKVEIS